MSYSVIVRQGNQLAPDADLRVVATDNLDRWAAAVVADAISRVLSALELYTLHVDAEEQVDVQASGRYEEPPVSPCLVAEPYDGSAGAKCSGCGAPKGKRHGLHCVVND